MLERSIIVGGLALAVVALWAGLRVAKRWRLQRLAMSSVFGELVPAGRPAIVSFSTPSCAECRTRQAPALARVDAALGPSVTLRSLSALDHPELVEQLGILTVPATAIVDASGRVRQLNLGYTDASKLMAQLHALT